LQEDLPSFNKGNPSNNGHDWQLGDAYWFVTGYDQRFIQIWTVPSDENTESATARLATASWRNLIQISPNEPLKILNPTNFDQGGVLVQLTGAARPAGPVLTTIGERGLVICTRDAASDEKVFYYVKEDDWRQMILSTPPSNLPVGTALTEITAQPQTLFVDLDAIPTRPIKANPGISPLRPSPEPTIILCEGRSFYEVKRAAWKKFVNTLSDADARVFVNSGDVVAQVPQNAVPVGAYCVLLNFSNI
jgi:hypothetical protein